MLASMARRRMPTLASSFRRRTTRLFEKHKAHRARDERTKLGRGALASMVSTVSTPPMTNSRSGALPSYDDIAGFEYGRRMWRRRA